MPDTTNLEVAQSTETTVGATDRRRPGRVENVNPKLIPLLRNQEADIVFEPEDIEQTAAIRGLAIGLVLSAPIWAAIAYAGSFLLSK